MFGCVCVCVCLARPIWSMSMIDGWRDQLTLREKNLCVCVGFLKKANQSQFASSELDQHRSIRESGLVEFQFKCDDKVKKKEREKTMVVVNVG